MWILSKHSAHAKKKPCALPLKSFSASRKKFLPWFFKILRETLKILREFLKILPWFFCEMQKEFFCFPRTSRTSSPSSISGTTSPSRLSISSRIYRKFGIKARFCPFILHLLGYLSPILHQPNTLNYNYLSPKGERWKMIYQKSTVCAHAREILNLNTSPSVLYLSHRNLGNAQIE